MIAVDGSVKCDGGPRRDQDRRGAERDGERMKTRLITVLVAQCAGSELLRVEQPPSRPTRQISAVGLRRRSRVRRQMGWASAVRLARRRRGFVTAFSLLSRLRARRVLRSPTRWATPKVELLQTSPRLSWTTMRTVSWRSGCATQIGHAQRELTRSTFSSTSIKTRTPGQPRLAALNIRSESTQSTSTSGSGTEPVGAKLVCLPPLSPRVTRPTTRI